MIVLKNASKMKINAMILVMIILTLYAFISSAVYYYPAYSIEGIDRDFYMDKVYYVLFVIIRGVIFTILFNGFYLAINFIVKSLYKIFIKITSQKNHQTT